MLYWSGIGCDHTPGFRLLLKVVLEPLDDDSSQRTIRVPALECHGKFIEPSDFNLAFVEPAAHWANSSRFNYNFVKSYIGILVY